MIRRVASFFSGLAPAIPSWEWLASGLRLPELGKPHASAHDLAVAFQQLSLMLSSGLGTAAALEVLTRQTSGHLGQALDNVGHDVIRRGHTLSAALSRHPQIFDQSILLLVRSGEQSRDLSVKLQRVAEMLERKYALSCRLKEALASPLLTSLACGLVLWGIVKLVLPRFLGLYESMNVKLPAISLFVISGVQLVNHPLFLVAVALLVLFCASRWREFRQTLLEWGLHMRWTRPIIGNVLAVSFLDTLATTQRDGISIHRGLELLRSTTPWNVHRQHLSEVIDSFMVGGSLAQAMAEIPYFPTMVTSMMWVGEESGQLADLLFATREILEEQNEILLSQLVGLIEPAAIALMGVVMGTMCIGMFLPIYGLLTHLGGS